ncbi:MAG: leucine-rich repeat domain-containing protein, partial [Maricaulaceae bacterium]
TPVADLAPLKHLANLKTLYLSSTQVSDLTPLRDLKNLEHLFLNETQVADLTPVRHVKSIYGATPEAYATIGRDAEGNPVED